MFLGVCQGLADWRDFSVGWLRFFVAMSFLFFFPIAPIVYIIIALVLNKEPRPEDLEPQSRHRLHPREQAYLLKEEVAALEARAAGLEQAVLDREGDWDRRFYRA